MLPWAYIINCLIESQYILLRQNGKKELSSKREVSSILSALSLMRPGLCYFHFQKKMELKTSQPMSRYWVSINLSIQIALTIFLLSNGNWPHSVPFVSNFVSFSVIEFSWIAYPIIIPTDQMLVFIPTFCLHSKKRSCALTHNLLWRHLIWFEKKTNVLYIYCEASYGRNNTWWHDLKPWRVYFETVICMCIWSNFEFTKPPLCT